MSGWDTHSLETEGKMGLGCLISLCPCPVLFFGSDFGGDAEADSCFVDFLVDSSFAELPFPSLLSPLALGSAERSGPRSLGTSIFAKSSPCSANMAMICPTGIFDVPSCTCNASALDKEPK